MCSRGMHRAGADFPLFQPHLRGIGWWKDSVPRLEPHIPDDVFHRLADELIYQDSFFRSARFERLPAGPIHADLFRDNVLIVSTPAGDAIGGLIDFYFAGCSIWLFDLAVTMNDWCIDLATGAFDPARAQAMIDAYHAARPLDRRGARVLAHGPAGGGAALLDLAAVRLLPSASGRSPDAARPDPLRTHPRAPHR